MEHLVAVLFIVISIYHAFKKNEALFALILFYQHVSLIVFDNYGVERFAYIYFVLLSIIFIIRSNKIYTTWQRYINPITLSFLILLLIMSYHYYLGMMAPDNFRGFNTYTNFLLYNIPFVILLLMYFPSKSEAYKNLLEGIIIYGFVLIIAIIFISGLRSIEFDFARGEFRDEFRMSPLALAKASGMVVISVLLLIFNDPNKKYILLYYIIGIMAFGMLVVTASRASFIFLFITASTFFLYREKSILKKLIYLGLFALVSLSVLIIIENLNLPIIERLQRLENYETMLRYRRIEVSLEMFANREFGLVGLGPFGFGYNTGLNYPHNMIVEMIVDYGIFGFISLIILTFYGFKYYIIVSKMNYVYAWLAPMFMYNYLTRLTSGDIAGIRHLLFTAILLAIIISFINNNRNKNYNEKPKSMSYS